MRKILAVTKGYIALLLGLMVICVWVLVAGSRPVSGDRSPVRVGIAQGTSATEIGRILAGKGLIRSPFVFVFTCRLSGSSGKLKPGVYEFSRAMSAPEIIRDLVRGEALESWITVPEGFTARQIADVLEERQLIRADAFVRLAISGGSEFGQYSFIEGDSLEGYLFPDTYLISRGIEPHAIIEKMLDAFDKKVVVGRGKEIERAVRARFGTPTFADGLAKLLTVASLVEREAKIPKDRKLIAAVIYNRLAKNMRLEVDATVSYVPGDSRANRSEVNYSDLETDSPYNTYEHAGLPPGPICNPGLAAIEAAMDPAHVDYLFYVAKPDGSHVFTRTLAEHNKAKHGIKREAAGD